MQQAGEGGGAIDPAHAFDPVRARSDRGEMRGRESLQHHDAGMASIDGAQPQGAQWRGERLAQAVLDLQRGTGRCRHRRCRLTEHCRHARTREHLRRNDQITIRLLPLQRRQRIRDCAPALQVAGIDLLSQRIGQAFLVAQHRLCIGALDQEILRRAGQAQQFSDGDFVLQQRRRRGLQSAQVIAGAQALQAAADEAHRRQRQHTADQVRPQARPARQAAGDDRGEAAVPWCAGIQPREPQHRGDEGRSQCRRREHRHLSQAGEWRDAERHVSQHAGQKCQRQCGQQAAHHRTRRHLGVALPAGEIMDAVVLGHAGQACAEHQRDQVHLAEDPAGHRDRGGQADQQRGAHQHDRPQAAEGQPHEQQYRQQRAQANRVHLECGPRCRGLRMQGHAATQHLERSACRLARIAGGSVQHGLQWRIAVQPERGLRALETQQGPVAAVIVADGDQPVAQLHALPCACLPPGRPQSERIVLPASDPAADRRVQARQRHIGDGIRPGRAQPIALRGRQQALPMRRKRRDGRGHRIGVVVACRSQALAGADGLREGMGRIARGCPVARREQDHDIACHRFRQALVGGSQPRILGGTGQQRHDVGVDRGCTPEHDLLHAQRQHRNQPRPG